MNRKTREDIIDRYLKLVNLEGYRYYYPSQLSGGMKQRISILRAFAYPSKVLIMDEPFKSLDVNSKYTIMKFTLKLKKTEGKTCIIVTHDIDEALTLGDRIVILTGKPTKVKKIIENIPAFYGDKKDYYKLKKVIEEELMD